MGNRTTRREIIKQGALALTALALPFPFTTLKKFNLMTDVKNFDVIIIGGSYAGLSSAMSLGRSMRNVLIIDSGLPCNRHAPHSHNFITQDGEKPNVIAEKAKTQVLRYKTVKFQNGLAVSGKKFEDGFAITTQAEETFIAKKLVFATGIKDIMPAIRGFSECWGISVVQCPYCHGYEVRGLKTGLLANGERAYHLSGMINNLTDNLVILTNGQADFDTEQSNKLKKHKISINEKEIDEIIHENGVLKNILFKDGSEQDFQTLYAVVPFEQHSDIPTSMGCELNEFGYIKVDGFHRTNIDGIYACGDNTAMMRSVANAVATGNFVGAMINKELVDEQF